MRKIVCYFALFCLCTITSAQTIADKVFDKYAGTEGFTTVYITKYMFDLFRDAAEDAPKDDDMAEVLSNLSSIKILATDDDPATSVKVNLYQEVMKELPVNLYKELMVIKEKDQDVKFLVREEKGKVVELLMLVGGKEESVLICIQGVIDMKTIGKLASGMDIEGMENLEKIDE
ncbi:MAG: DUF4252 domain-containing protein [Bacteroidales bacterium]|nr:DUF4252 domain-containing protein [Bacteroidales bacterium]